MISNKKSSYFLIGLALFSMFFGSGNLIFPLFIGQLTEDHALSGILGFLLTAVMFPFIGVIAMIIFKGKYKKFFNCLGKRTGFILTFLLLSVWIPFGSAPRCIALAYASLLPYLSMPPFWAFSLIYCVLIAFVVVKRSVMFDLLGYVLTPLLLFCLAMIIGVGLYYAPSISASTFSHGDAFYMGLKEGYNTMDLIAAFFFSASVIEMLSKLGDEKKALRTAWKACLVGMILLSIVYVGLICLAATYATHLEMVPKEQLLATISKSVLGPYWGGVSAIAILLACFTTSVALVAVYCDFLHRALFAERKGASSFSMGLTLLISFVISLFGLKGITQLTSPILQVCYPLLILLIVVNIGRWIYVQRRAVLVSE